VRRRSRASVAINVQYLLTAQSERRVGERTRCSPRMSGEPLRTVRDYLRFIAHSHRKNHE